MNNWHFMLALSVLNATLVFLPPLGWLSVFDAFAAGAGFVIAAGRYGEDGK